MSQPSSFIKKLSFFLAVLFASIMTACASGTMDDTTVDPAANLPAEAIYPEQAIAPETSDFSKSAVAFVAGMGTGWNLGNTLDAYGAADLTSETSWGQPMTTKAMIAGLKASGIKTIRIPISWHTHVNSAFTVDSAWMARVKEVVDYAIGEGMYVIINIHHDNDKAYDAYYFPDSLHANWSREYVRRVWKQIALQFRNYDEHLIFEILNEPRLVGYANEWGWSDSDSSLATAASIIGDLEQSALTAIRETESNNANRYVMITPYVAAPSSALSSKFKIPTDTATDKLILSVHAYQPYSFAMQDPGETKFTNEHKAQIDSIMEDLNAKFVAGKHMPVIIGEYGATNKNNLADRVAWFSYFVGKAKSYGIVTVLWDNGNWKVPASGKFEELYGFYNRTAQTWYFPDILTAIINASK
jgi:endoglucanase